MSVLIFPANSSDSLLAAREKRLSGLNVFGASLNPHDPLIQADYEQIYYLPHVSAPEFETALLSLLGREQITELCTPLRVVYEYLNQILPDQISLSLLTLHRVDVLLAFVHEQVTIWMGSNLVSGWPVPLQQKIPDASVMAAILYQALQFPGQSHPAKLLTCVPVLASSLPGDIVEVGVYWGRSLAMLGFLAQHYSLGTVLGIDTWPEKGFTQGNPLLDRFSERHQFESIYQGLGILLWPLRQQVQLERRSSLDAAEAYAQQGLQESSPHKFKGKISVLHLDGNHAPEALEADLKAWLPLLADEAWVILDDYRWGFDSGPQEVADRFMLEYHAEIKAAFVCAESLWLCLRRT